MIAVALFFGAHQNYWSGREQPRLFVYLSEGIEGELKAYWDFGRGYSEANAVAKRMGDYSRQLITWEIPEEVLRIRLDPTTGARELRIDRIEVGFVKGLRNVKVKLADLGPVNQLSVKTLGAPGNWLLQIEENSIDPYLILDSIPSLMRKAERSAMVVRRISFALVWLPVFIPLWGCIRMILLKR